MRYLFILLLFISCATPKIQTSSIQNSDEITLNYYISYPSYKGITKTLADRKRIEYLNTALTRIFESIYRIGDYESNKFDELISYQFGPLPFQFLPSKNLLTYHDTPYSKVSGNFYVYKNSSIFSKQKGELIKPIAYLGAYPKWKWSDDITFLTIGRGLKEYYESNFINLNKKQLEIEIKKFYKLNPEIDAKKTFQNFLDQIQFWKIANKAPETKPKIIEIFDQGHKSTKSFILNKYNHYPYNKKTGFSLSYDPNKFIWGIITLLNSDINIISQNKNSVKVQVKVPLRKIKNKYNTESINKYIE